MYKILNSGSLEETLCKVNKEFEPSKINPLPGEKTTRALNCYHLSYPQPFNFINSLFNSQITQKQFHNIVRQIQKKKYRSP